MSLGKIEARGADRAPELNLTLNIRESIGAEAYARAPQLQRGKSLNRAFTVGGTRGSPKAAFRSEALMYCTVVSLVFWVSIGEENRGVIILIKDIWLILPLATFCHPVLLPIASSFQDPVTGVFIWWRSRKPGPKLPGRWSSWFFTLATEKVPICAIFDRKEGSCGDARG